MNDSLMFIGTFTSTNRGGNSNGGIIVCHGKDDNWRSIQHIYRENSSFLCLNNKKNMLYAVEGNGTHVYMFKVSNELRKLIPNGEALTNFQNGVACTVSPDDRYLITASCNKKGGGLTIFPLNTDGAVTSVSTFLTMRGQPGPLSNHQLVSKPHQIVFDPSGKFMLVVDKGTDKIYTFKFMSTGNVEYITSCSFRPASCPRHIAFHPYLPTLYLLTEYFGTIVSCSWINGIITPFAIYPTLPVSFTGLKNLAGEVAVHPSGHWLYASNRGHDSIVRFCIEKNGELSNPVWFTDDVIRTPRFFTLSPDGKWFYCSNQTGNCISIYQINHQNGTLSKMTSSINIRGSSSIVFIN